MPPIGGCGFSRWGLKDVVYLAAVQQPNKLKVGCLCAGFVGQQGKAKRKSFGNLQNFFIPLPRELVMKGVNRIPFQYFSIQ